MKLVIVLVISAQVLSLASAAGFDFNLDDFKIAARRLKRQGRPESICLQPPLTPDKNYTVRFPNKEDFSDAKPGEIVPQFTIIISRCKEGYAADYETDASSVLLSVCENTSWQPSVLKCKRICNNFVHFSNFNMSCYKHFGGPEISCIGLLLEGAVVFPRCRKKFHPDIKINYEYATCRKDGTWDKQFFKCLPDCGKTSRSVPLIIGGVAEKRGGAPWYVAIYSKQLNTEMPDVICGGTLINEEFIISAAHCFYDEVFQQNLDIKFYHAIVGKATRDYKKKDYETTKTYTLKNIYLPKTFKGYLTNYAGDIAILQLSEKVSFSQDVHPACLSLDARGRFDPGENVPGKLSGFGKTANGSLAPVLFSADLPFISYDECLKKDGFISTLSLDKFCAGSSTGPGARPGDSGGGVLFLDNSTGLYHLRGIISTKDISASSIASCTDVSYYISWISKIMESIEQKLDSPVTDSRQCILPPTTPDLTYTTSCSKEEKCRAQPGERVMEYTILVSTCNSGHAQHQDGRVSSNHTNVCFNGSWTHKIPNCKQSLKWMNFTNGDKCSNAVVGGNSTLMNETLYIARCQIYKNLIPGQLSPSKNVAIVSLSFEVYTCNEYEVLCGGSTEWVPAKDGEIPPGAILGGLGYGDSGDAETMYVCRAMANDKSVVPGELHSSQKACYIPYLGGEAIVAYEVLVQHNATACDCNTIGSQSSICEGTSQSCKCKPNVIGKNCDRCAPDAYGFGPEGCKKGLGWQKYSRGNKCLNAVVGGNRTPMNEVLYIARTYIDDRILIGKLVLSQKLAYVPWLSWEYSRLEYEVLCGGPTKWVAASKGLIPEGAFVGGMDNGDIGQEKIYVCRAKADDGSIVPGMLNPSEKVCYIANGHKKHAIGNYEVLVVL